MQKGLSRTWYDYRHLKPRTPWMLDDEWTVRNRRIKTCPTTGDVPCAHLYHI